MTPGNALYQLFKTLYERPDPGNGNTIYVRSAQFAVFPLVSTGAETRTLAQPVKAGLITTVEFDTDGGDITLTVTGGYNADADTSITLGDAGDFVTFISVKVGTSFLWRVIAQEGTNVAEEVVAADLVSAASILATNISIGTGLTAPNIVAGTAISANSILATNASIGTGLTAPNIVAGTAISANSILATNLSVGTAATVPNLNVASHRTIGGQTVQVSGGTGSVDSQATALLSPTLAMLSVATASNNYFKLPAAALGLACNVINVGASTAVLIGDTTDVSIASATAASLATANASGSALNLVCDGTNWWKRAL